MSCTRVEAYGAGGVTMIPAFSLMAFFQFSDRMIGLVLEAESRAFSSIPEEDRAAAIRTLRQFRLSLTLELEGISYK